MGHPGRPAYALLFAASVSLFLAACTSTSESAREQRLHRAITSTDALQRRRALSTIKRDTVTPGVRQTVERILLTDVDPTARALAAEALARAAGREAAEQLRLSARTDTSWVVRERALAALVSALREEATEDIAFAIANDPYATVSIRAIELAAGALEPQQAARVILGGLRSESPAVRLSAYGRLREIVGELDIRPEDYEAWKRAVQEWTEVQDLRTE